MLRKISLVAIMLGSFLASPVFAKAPTNAPYMGINLEGNYLSFKKDVKNSATNDYSKLVKATRPGAGLFAGYRWDCLGAEIGASWIQTKTVKINNIKSHQKNYNFYVDGTYYYAVSNDLDLKASLGVGYLTSKMAMGKINYTDNGGRIGARAGVGAQYYFTDHVSSSLKYTFQTGNKMVKNLQQVALGVAYHF